jgi:hypothetical protein
MIELSAQIAIVSQALKRLPMQKQQRDALVAAHKTLQKLDSLRTKIVALSPGDETTDIIAEEFVDLLGLEPRQVVSVYGDGKHAPVPQG